MLIKAERCRVVLQEPIRSIQSNVKYICEMNGRKEYKYKDLYYVVGIEEVQWFLFQIENYIVLHFKVLYV